MGAQSLWAADPGVHRGYGDGRYMLSVQTEYDYNLTWEHGMGVNVQALCPVNEHFELDARFQAQTANVYTLAAVARPKFALPVGELFVETEVLYKAVARARQNDFCLALSMGYRMDYVQAQLGYFMRVMSPFDVEHHSSSKPVAEIANMLYVLSVSCRPQAECWNITATMSNMDMYNLERHWAPLFMLDGRYDVDDHWRVTLGAQLKPTGIFHQQASLYGAYVRAGFAYKF